MRCCALFLACLLLLSSCGVREPGTNPMVASQTNGATSADCAALLIPTQPPARPTAPSEPTAPQVSPAPLSSPAPTAVVTTLPVPYENQAATAVAVATAQPFPTAAPPVVQVSQPAEARGERGGLRLTLTVPSDQLLAGEATQTILTLHNDRAESLWITGDGAAMGWLRLQDDRGEALEPWPWTMVERPGGSYLISIAPGETLTTTLTLQTPPLAAVTDQPLALWAATRFARNVPGADGPDNIWLHLEAGPLPLTLVAPRPDQQLTAELVLDRSGYELRGRNSDGQPVAGAWGELEASFSVPGQFESFTSRPLAAADGVWTGGWDEQMRSEQAQIAARAWVAAPGFVTAALTQTVSTAPLTDEVVIRAFGGGWAPCRQQFADSAAARAGLGLPVAQLTVPPLDASLVAVQAEVLPGWATITTRYDLSNQTWLALTQHVTTEQYDSAGWGDARYNPEVQPLQVGTEQGYLVQRYGFWVLNWKLGTTGLELRAPVARLSVPELVRLATLVEVVP